MVRRLLVLGLGIAIGYSLGFKDARQHDQTVVGRVLERVGGSARDYKTHDVDALMMRTER